MYENPEICSEGGECLICGKPVPEYTPEYCCSGYACSCRGKPIEPPVCSKVCEKALMDGTGGSMEERCKEFDIPKYEELDNGEFK